VGGNPTWSLRALRMLSRGSGITVVAALELKSPTFEAESHPRTTPRDRAGARRLSQSARTSDLTISAG
jgi:hypothetical protein